jgi:DNA replication protein DnaC
MTRGDEGYSHEWVKIPTNGHGRPTPPDSMDETLARFEATYQRRIAEDKVRLERFDAWLAEQPDSITCTVHQDIERPVDREASLRAHPVVEGREDLESWLPVYGRCPVCDQDKRLIAAGVPPNLIHCRFENFVPRDEIEREHLQTVQEFTQKRIGFVILAGLFGTGKSHLAVSALRSFRRGRFVKQSSLLRWLRSTYQDHDIEDPIEACQNADLFVLDEIGVSGGGKDEAPMIYDILDSRYGSFLPTILTSNLDKDQLMAVLGERVADRLSECGVGFLKFGSKSHRRQMRDVSLSTSKRKRLSDQN